MAADQVLRNTQSKARPIGAPGHERIKNRFAKLREHSRAVVFELNGRDLPVAPCSVADIACRARSQYQARGVDRATRQRLLGIAA